MTLTDKPAATISQTRWGIVFLLFGAGVVAAFQIGKVPPAIPNMRPDLGLSLFAASWVVSIFSIIGATSGILIGAVSDWAGHRRTIIFGMGMMALGNFGGGLAQSETVLLCSRFVEGIGYIFTAIAAPALIVNIADRTGFRLAISIWGCFMAVGMSTMMIISPLILNYFGWRGLWFFNGIIVTLIGIMLLRMIPRNQIISNITQKLPAERVQDIILTLKKPGPLLLSVSLMTASIQFMALMSFLPTFFIEECGMGQVKASLFTALTIAVNLTGNIGGGWLLQREIPRWKLIALSNAIISITTLGIYSTGTPEGIRLILCLVFSAVHGIMPTVILAGAPIHAPKPELMGTTNGLIMQGSNMGHVIGPPILAAVVSMTGGWHGVPLLYLLAACAGVAISLGIRTSERSVSHITRS